MLVERLAGPAARRGGSRRAPSTRSAPASCATHGEAIGIAPDYTILDREDQRRLLKDLLEDLGVDAGRLKPPEVGAR